MKKEEFQTIERYMLTQRFDIVHDELHIQRVLYYALRIAKDEGDVDLDVLIAACLLHDIGRGKEDGREKHAVVGSRMANSFLTEIGWSSERAKRVEEAIATHSYGKDSSPESLEAKILYDADKLDLTGAVGTARALIFGATIDEPLYRVDEDGRPSAGAAGEKKSSIFREYNRKLKNLSERFFTESARRIAVERQETMDAFFKGLRSEVDDNYAEGQRLLEEKLEN